MSATCVAMQLLLSEVLEGSGIFDFLIRIQMRNWFMPKSPRVWTIATPFSMASRILKIMKRQLFFFKGEKRIMTICLKSFNSCIH